MIRFRVNGIPAPQGNLRSNRAGKAYYPSKAIGPWREAVRAEAQKMLPYPLERDWALDVEIRFVLPRPKIHYGSRKGQWYLKDSAPSRPAGRPDVDKLARAVLDGLVAGGVMADDAQVVDLSVSKVYAGDGEAPGAVIEVSASGP